MLEMRRGDHMQRASLNCAAALLAALFVACGGSSPTDPAPPILTDAISVSSVTPVAGSVLRAGQTVTFTAAVNYTLATAASGRIAIVIQDQTGESLDLPGEQSSVSVSRGTGSATLSSSVTIPNSGVTSVIVYLPLLPAGATTTSIVARVEYAVG